MPQTEWAVKCQQCGIIERGTREECNHALENHDQFHTTSLLRPATDGGQEIDTDGWYVLDSSRDAVVSGPHPEKSIAEGRARGEPIYHIVVDGNALESIQGDTRLVWENGDVDVVTDGGVDQPIPCEWRYEAVVHGADLHRDCLALTGSGDPCSYQAYAGNSLPVCNMHADTDDPTLVVGGHQWARIQDGDVTVAVCVKCEDVWRGGTPALAVDCPECGRDAGVRCRQDTGGAGTSAPIPPHPQRRRQAMGVLDDYERCPVEHDLPTGDGQDTLVTDGGQTVDRLYYATASNAARRHLHVDEDCEDLQQAKRTNSAPVTHPPRGKLCPRCAPDTTLSKLQETAVATDGGVDRLHYATHRNASQRKLHVDDDCDELDKATNTSSCPATHPPRGELCETCASGQTLDELQDGKPVTDGGQPHVQSPGAAVTPAGFAPYGGDHVRQLAGVGDQDTTCEHGTKGCPGPGGGLDQCFDCFLGGGDGE